MGNKFRVLDWGYKNFSNSFLGSCDPILVAQQTIVTLLGNVTSRRFSDQKNDVEVPLEKENMKTWHLKFVQ